MHDGLKIIQLPGNYYGRGVTLIGWMRRISGDEWELMPGARVIWRKSGDFNHGGLDNLAANGLGKDYDASEPAKGAEHINRLLIRRARPADEKAWVKHCPKPKGWVDRG